MQRRHSIHTVVGGLLLATLAGIGDGQAQDQQLMPTADVASQRQWLLRQVRLGEASGRQELVENALDRLRLLAPDDAGTLLALLEVQLSRNRVDEARQTLQRLRQGGQGSAELAAAQSLWDAYAGDDQDALREARVLVSRDQKSEALHIYRRLFKDAPPGLQLGVEYWRLRGSEPAARTLAIGKLRQLDRLYPDSPMLLQALSRLLFSAKQPDEALAILQRMGRLQGMQSQAAQVEWGYLDAQPADARSVLLLEKFIQRYPEWSRIGEVRQRHVVYRRRMADPAWRTGRAGLQLLAEGRNGDAEQELRTALRAYPDEAEFLGGLGLALMRQGQRAQALELFGRAERSASDSGRSKWISLAASTRYWLLLEQAAAALEADELDRAQALYTQARRGDSREPRALLGLAKVAEQRGDNTSAERHLLAARRLAPADADVQRRLARFYQSHDPARFAALLQTLPASGRQSFEQELRQQQLQMKRRQFEQMREQGHGDGLIELGRELRREWPADPWLAHALALELQAAGNADEADAVIADMVGAAGERPEARYAQALYLSASQRTAQALEALEALPPAQWSTAMQALAERLHRQQRWDTAMQLRQKGHVDDAIALLRQAPTDIDTQLLLADWLKQRGDMAEAGLLYRQVLQARPQEIGAQLGQLEAWLGDGQQQRARDWLASAPAVLAGDNQHRQRQLAGIWSALDEPARALALLQELLAAKTTPDPQAWRDAARLLRRNDPQQALDLYARAMEENGLLAPLQAQPRDNRALTRASRETAGDDWLRRSLRSEVEALYRQHNPTVTVMQDSGRRSDGTPGLSKLSRDTRMVHLDAPFAGGLGWARIEQVDLDAGLFQTDADGFHDADFGSCKLSLLRADGSRLPAPGCNTGLHQRMVSGAGLALGWHPFDDRWSIDLGHTPSGYAVGNWLGGVSVKGDLGRFGWGATLSRRPMSNSLLSQAGAIDPRSGITWGGVTANGGTFSLGYDKGGRNGLWSNWSWQHLSGHNVADNSRAPAMAGWYHKLIQRPDLRLDVGLTGMYWRYAHDLGGYTLGQGGYYSPQRYTSLGVPLNLAWRNEDWSLRVDAALSVSSARSEASDRFPEQGLNVRVLALLEAQYGPLALDEARRYSRGGSSSGRGHRLHAAIERRLGGHVVLGAAATLQRSQDYSPNTFQLYLRYTREPWQGNLSLPPSSLVPYGEFR